MDLARRQAMDAQRFDPMRRKSPLNLPIPSTKAHSDMGQALRRLSHPELPPNGVVGGIWSDHELVLVPLEVTSHRISMGSFLAESFTSTSTSSSSSDAIDSEASYASSSTYFSTSSPTLPEDDALDSSPSTTSARQVDTYDRDDLIITRTIIRPAAHATGTLRGMFSRPSSPPTVSRPMSPLLSSRPNTPVFQALNCFRPTGFERDVDDDMVGSQPVLQVIVTQTREQYEQDLAFKEVVREVYPEAGARRRRAVRDQ